MQKCTTVGISLLSDTLARIDSERGLISRSVYLREILKEIYPSTQKTNDHVKNQKQVEGPSKDTSTCSTVLNLPATQGSE